MKLIIILCTKESVEDRKGVNCTRVVCISHNGSKRLTLVSLNSLAALPQQAEEQAATFLTC